MGSLAEPVSPTPTKAAQVAWTPLLGRCYPDPPHVTVMKPPSCLGVACISATAGSRGRTREAPELGGCRLCPGTRHLPG